MQYREYLFGFSFKLFTYAFYIPHNFVYLYHIFNKIMYLSIIKYASREINSKLTNISSMYSTWIIVVMRGTITVSSMAVETSDGEMVRAVLRNLVGFLRGEGPGYGRRHAKAELAGPALPFLPCGLSS